MLEKISTLQMSREDWLAERRKSIGGSDVGAILGMNPFRSPYAVWAEKTGRITEDEDNEAMRQGRDLEQYVADRFTEKSGWKTRKVNFILRNKVNAPHLHANIDRKITLPSSKMQCENDGVYISCDGLECKTASTLNMKKFAGGQFPESYYAQCVAYLAVTGWRRWYLAALVFGKGFYVYQLTTIENDTTPDWCESSVYVSQDEIKALTSYVNEFWEKYIAANVPPPVDGLESTTEAIEKSYTEDNGNSIEIIGLDALASYYFQLLDQKNYIENQINKIKQQIQSNLGENSESTCYTAKVSWKTQERSTFDWKAFAKDNPDVDLEPYFNVSKSRFFRIKKLEEQNG